MFCKVLRLWPLSTPRGFIQEIFFHCCDSFLIPIQVTKGQWWPLYVTRYCHQLFCSFIGLFSFLCLEGFVRIPYAWMSLVPKEEKKLVVLLNLLSEVGGPPFFPPSSNHNDQRSGQKCKAVCELFILARLIIQSFLFFPNFFQVTIVLPSLQSWGVNRVIGTSLSMFFITRGWTVSSTNCQKGQASPPLFLNQVICIIVLQNHQIWQELGLCSAKIVFPLGPPSAMHQFLDFEWARRRGEQWD